MEIKDPLPNTFGRFENFSSSSILINAHRDRFHTMSNQEFDIITNM